jgi:hypothetical protein
MLVRSSRSKAGIVDALADGDSIADDEEDDADADADAGRVGGAAVGSSSRMIVSLPPRSREAEEPISQCKSGERRADDDKEPRKCKQPPR